MKLSNRSSQLYVGSFAVRDSHFHHILNIVFPKDTATATVVVDMVALDVSPIAVGAAVVVTSLIFGIKVEEISPISTLVSATGSILKL